MDNIYREVVISFAYKIEEIADCKIRLQSSFSVSINTTSEKKFNNVRKFLREAI